MDAADDGPDESPGEEARDSSRDRRDGARESCRDPAPGAAKTGRWEESTKVADEPARPGNIRDLGRASTADDDEDEDEGGAEVPGTNEWVGHGCVVPGPVRGAGKMEAAEGSET